MKKLFTSPAIEVKSLSPETEVMGVFSLASSVGVTSETVTVVKDTTSKADGDSFGYWGSKQ